MKSITDTYLNHFDSSASRQRACYELGIISKLLNLSRIDDIDWSTFGRAEVLEMASSAAFRAKRPNSQNFTLRILKGLCREANLAGLMPESSYNAVASIQSVRGRRTNAREVPKKEEIIEILAHCAEDGEIGIRDAAIFAIALGCGLRRSEIANLKCSDLDFSQSSLRIVGKGNKERLVFFCEAVAARLEAWRRIRGSGGAGFFFVPIHKTGRLLVNRHINDETVYQIIRRRSSEVLNHPIAPHDFRRYFASELLDKSVDINTVRIAMGHSDIRTTMIYDKRDELERLKRISSITML